MTAGVERVRRELAELLQEQDPHRELDSLEGVVVRTWLRGNEFAPPEPSQGGPRTIEGWVSWVERCSSGS